MGIFSSGTSTFNELLEKATSQLLLEPEWNLILQLCDCIRQQDVTPKYALGAIKNRMSNQNPHVSLFALTVLEACVKNCGAAFHAEVATKQFMDDLRAFVKICSEPCKEKTLGLIQAWSSAFRGDSKYKAVQDTYNLMKLEGYTFPSFNESDAMFAAEGAPEWAEGDVCHMCRVKFGMVQRQHHCRSCGQVFCGKCSSKTSIIPQYGIEREVRVCDPCYYKLNPASKPTGKEKSTKEDSAGDLDLPPEYLNSPLSKEDQVPPSKSERELQEQEEEDLQLAMALSISQDDTSKEVRKSGRSYNSPSSGSSSSSQRSKSAYSQAISELEVTDGGMDPELARYLNRSYWEDRSEKGPPRASPTAPVETTSGFVAQKKGGGKGKKKKEKKRRDTSDSSPRNSVEPTVADGQEMQGSDVLVQNIRSNINMLMERMQNISSRGKHIAMDATVQSLFQTVSAMHPQLLRLMEEQEERTENYKNLQEKLGLVREARSGLDEAREQHREKVRQQELEQDMLRRIQIEQKLELMRQQKTEYLAYQQRLQAERQQALEQQQQQQQRQSQEQLAQAPYRSHAYGDMSPYSSLGYMAPTAAVSAAAAPQPSSLPYVQQPPAVQGSSMLPPADASMQYAPQAHVPLADGPYPAGPPDYSVYGVKEQPMVGDKAPHAGGPFDYQASAVPYDASTQQPPAQQPEAAEPQYRAPVGLVHPALDRPASEPSGHPAALARAQTPAQGGSYGAVAQQAQLAQRVHNGAPGFHAQPTHGPSYGTAPPPQGPSYGGAAPPQGHSYGAAAPAQAPSYGGTAQAPPQGSSYGEATPSQGPPFGGAGQAPPQGSSYGGAGQAPPQGSSYGGAGQAPPQGSSYGGAGQAPPQGSSYGGAGQAPPQGPVGQAPPQGSSYGVTAPTPQGQLYGGAGQALPQGLSYGGAGQAPPQGTPYGGPPVATQQIPQQQQQPQAFMPPAAQQMHGYQAHPPPPHYHEAAATPSQPPGPAPQRQLSDLELISFD